ncbi:MAG: aromatic amino acid ammonia-lyase [Pseudomonadota bacterium]
MRDEETGPADLVPLGGHLSLASAYRVAEGQSRVALSPEARHSCQAAHSRLSKIIEEGRHVYGVTTGFGPLANRLIEADQGPNLQQNLIHHLATGLGPELGWSEARLVLLARLNSIARGLSGASEASISALEAISNSDLAPALPSRGTVGASGDLTPLAHMVLCLQARGDFLERDGTRVDGRAALKRLGLAPLGLDNRDGLALVNGTSAMTGIAVRTAVLSRRAVDWALALTAGLAECLFARSEAWHMDFASARPHAGQRAATVALQRCLTGSDWVVVDPISKEHLSVSGVETTPLAGQDAYTLRCAPQVIGAVLDTLDWHDSIVEIELNSVTDNPILPSGYEPPALHGGNFMGQHVALASDSLSTALVVLAGFAERQIARVTDERLNRGLPAFLQGATVGLNSGLMGAQVTATAILSELRTGGAASIQSISTNGANQDVVSLGTVAARLAAAKLQGVFEVQAVLALCVAQAMDLRERGETRAFSGVAQRLRNLVREESGPLAEDRPLSEEITRLAKRLSQQSPP